MALIGSGTGALPQMDFGPHVLRVRQRKASGLTVLFCQWEQSRLRFRRDAPYKSVTAKASFDPSSHKAVSAGAGVASAHA